MFELKVFSHRLQYQHAATGARTGCSKFNVRDTPAYDSECRVTQR